MMAQKKSETKLGIIEDQANISTKTMDSDRSRQWMSQNFQLVWLDANFAASNPDFQHTLTQLRIVTNDVQVFTKVVDCVTFLQNMRNERVIAVSSGALGQDLMPQIHHMTQLDEIYIFSGNPTQHAIWTKQWSKIKGVYSDIELICKALQQAIKQCNQDLAPVNFIQVNNNPSHTNPNQLAASFMHTQIFKKILLDMKHSKQACRDLGIYCRLKYADDPNRLHIVDEFIAKYHPKEAIYWYTRECFLYHILNHALRLLEVDIIVNMGFFINDLHRQIEQLYKKQVKKYRGKSFIVYRGQGLSMTDFNQLQVNKGGLVSFNCFLSTSKKQDVSLQFARKASKNTDLVGILFAITIDPRIRSTPFADIKGVGSYPDESEILFSTHTVFRITSVENVGVQDRLYEVQLTLTADYDKDLRALTKELEKNIGNGTGWQRIGQLLIRIGEMDKAEELYCVLLEQTSDLSDQGFYNHQLGAIKSKQGDYKGAIRYYEKAVHIEEQTLSCNHPSLAASYNNIGLIYRAIGEHSTALQYYENAFNIKKKNLSVNNPSFAISYNNVGEVYYNMQDYPKALFCFQKALNIWQRSLHPTHPNIQNVLHWIDLVKRNM